MNFKMKCIRYFVSFPSCQIWDWFVKSTTNPMHQYFNWEWISTTIHYYLYLNCYLSIYLKDVLESSPVSLAYLCSSVQQKPDALGLSTEAGFVQRHDGVHRYNIDRSATLDEVLQLGSLALGCCLVHFCSLGPASCKGNGHDRTHCMCTNALLALIIVLLVRNENIHLNWVVCFLIIWTVL